MLLFQCLIWLYHFIFFNLLILIIKIHHESMNHCIFVTVHNLFTIFTVWKWFIIIATTTTMFSLIDFETICRIHKMLDKKLDLCLMKGKQFIWKMYISSAIISTIQSYVIFMEMWWKWHCDYLIKWGKGAELCVHCRTQK